jgi:hypothetical protein
VRGRGPAPVTGIFFSDDNNAVVRFAFQGPAIKAIGFDRSADILGTATRSGDTWVVGADALRNALTLAGNACP